ncbi:MAG TPA: AAA family ATPase, partial [Anaerolineales bacterium]
LVQGESLDVLRPQNCIEVVSIARQVCMALDHAHTHGIVHRDLKPENILITEDRTAKLTDFGLARSIVSRLGEDAGLVGTVFYLAPELALGQEFDGRADLYALGVMLYELTAGRMPFTGDDPLTIISQHLRAPVVPPRTFRPNIPPALEAIILKLMAKSPQDRYASASQVLVALDQLHCAPEANDQTAASGPVDTVALLEQLARGRLVGRSSELKQLQELWLHARDQGHGHLALISGEPGVGKTRLANEVVVYAQLGSATVLHGGCYEYEENMPYLPFVEALREWVHGQSEESLRSKLDTMAPELARLAPEIDSKLGPQAPNPPLSPNEERLRLFDHIARFLQMLARPHGLIFFIDDLHWADQGTLTLLHYLLRNLRAAPLLVLAAYREVELDRTHPFAAAMVEWNRERLATRILLKRLTPDSVKSLLASLFGQEGLSQGFVDAIYRETEGNPFFIEEVIKSLIEQGQIYRVDGHWERRELGELAIPQSIKEAVGRRLNRLTPATSNLLRTAAAIGRRFSFHELAAVSSSGEDELLDSLDEADRTQLVHAENDEAYIFTHDKIREVLYEELSPIRKRRMHHRIGEGLEKLYGAEAPSHAPDLAHHFIESCDLTRGLDYSFQAAGQAEKVFAHDEALNFYQHALECAEGQSPPDQVAAIHEAMGMIHYQCGMVQMAVDAFQRALDVSVAPEMHAGLKTRIGTAYALVGDERGVPFLEAALLELNPEKQPNELAMATAMLGRFYHYHAQFEQAIEFLKRALLLAEPSGNPATMTEIYAYLAGAYQQWERVEESIEWAQRCIELGERSSFPIAEAIGYEFLSEDAYMLGKWQDALHYAARDYKIAERIGALARMAWAESCRANAYKVHGDLAAALETANTCLKLAERIGDSRLAVLIRSVRASVQWDMGAEQAAQEDLDLTMAQAEASGQRQPYSWSLSTAVYLAAGREDWEEVLRLSDRWEELFNVRQNDLDIIAMFGLGRIEEVIRLLEADRLRQGRYQPHYRAFRLEFLGRFYTRQQEWEQALRCFEEAISIQEALEVRIDLGRSLVSRSRLYLVRGQPQEALADLERAKGIFTECGALPDLARAQILLDQLAVS